MYYPSPYVKEKLILLNLLKSRFIVYRNPLFRSIRKGFHHLFRFAFLHPLDFVMVR